MYIDFQMAYAQKAWIEERASWRSVVQLNLLRSVNFILDILNEELSGPTTSGSGSDDEEEDTALMDTQLQFSETHKLLKLRLAPLRRVQTDLERRLGSGAEEPIPVTSGMPSEAAPFDIDNLNVKHRTQEFYVRSSTGWKSALDKFRQGSRSSTEADAANRDKERRDREDEETAAIISRCKDDMHALWTDPVIRHMLARRKFRLEDSPGL